MSLVIVRAIRLSYPVTHTQQQQDEHPFDYRLGARHLEFLEAVARATSMGLVSKTSGAFIPHPTAGGVSQDVLMERGGAAVDILIDADGAASPAWQPIAPIDPSRYVSVSNGQPPSSDPLPQPPVPPPPDLSKILKKLDTLICRVADIDTQQRILTDRVEALRSEVEESHAILSLVGKILEGVVDKQDRAYTGKLGFSMRLIPEPTK